MVEQIGKYIVARVLGSGNFGVVYQARHPVLEKSVAIKKLKVQALEGESQADSRLQFTREASELSKLGHPNVVTVHDFGVDETDNAPYLVMELLEGETLQQLIRKRAGMPLIEKIEIMHQVAEGLQFAHTRGVIHRDIKPANIMVLADGTAKVFDFAVAPEGSLIGTPAYMAPEQARGQGSDVLTDVFAYGCVYYELLTGERAFNPDKPERAQKSPYEPARVATRVEGCPPWLDLLVYRLMAKRRDQRVDSLEEMLVEIRPTLQKLRQERAAELASKIDPLIKAGKREEADRLIHQVLRLDPLNPTGREWRGSLQAGQREQNKALAMELVDKGQMYFESGVDYALALSTFEEALVLDPGNPAIDKLADRARIKAEDQRTSESLLDEVIDDIVSAGPGGMASWQVETSFVKLSRATQLDPRNEDAATLCMELRPVYERICDQKMAKHSTSTGQAPTVFGNELYEKRLKDAIRARKNRQYSYAEEILRKLIPGAADDRAERELNAVAEDRETQAAAEEALRLARKYKAAGDLEAAVRELDDYAERHPRGAQAVQEERHALESAVAKAAGSGDGKLA